MMEYELINPSDPYTFIAADYETAALTIFCLGPAYGARLKDTGEAVPVFIFGGAVDWYKEKFGRTPDDGLNEKGQAVADALASVMLGDFEERRIRKVETMILTHGWDDLETIWKRRAEKLLDDDRIDELTQRHQAGQLTPAQASMPQLSIFPGDISVEDERKSA